MKKTLVWSLENRIFRENDRKSPDFRCPNVQMDLKVSEMERAHENTLVTVFWKIFNNKFRPKCKISSKPEVDQKKILKFFKTLPWPWEWIFREVFHAHYARTNSRSDLKSDILEKKFFRKNWKFWRVFLRSRIFVAECSPKLR